MLNIIINNINRILQQKMYLVLSIMLTICSVISAVFVTNSMEMKSSIAIVGDYKLKIESPYYNVTYLKENPPKSQLVENVYDAVIDTQSDGSYKVNTIKNDNYKKQLEMFLRNPSSLEKYKNDNRQIGTNILGFMIMFVLMQGVLYGRLFAEDKEKHLTERIIVSPLSFSKYLLGNGAFIWSLIFVPTFLVILIVKLLGLCIGFNLIQYMILIGIMALLSTGFSLLINSFFCNADKANMIGSAIIVLTSVLGGSFYSLSKDNTLLNKILYILPQKDFINYIDILEKGKITNDMNIQISYVILISVVFVIIGILKTRKDYVYKN